MMYSSSREWPRVLLSVTHVIFKVAVIRAHSLYAWAGRAPLVLREWWHNVENYINKIDLCMISKCIEVYEESRTSVKWSFSIAIKLLGHFANRNHTAAMFKIFPYKCVSHYQTRVTQNVITKCCNKSEKSRLSRLHFICFYWWLVELPKRLKWVNACIFEPILMDFSWHFLSVERSLRSNIETEPRVQWYGEGTHIYMFKCKKVVTTPECWKWTKVFQFTPRVTDV